MANASDYFKKVGSPGNATTLASPGHAIAGTSFTVDSTSLWPTDTGVTFGIDSVTIVDGEEVRIAGTYTVWDGVVASGTTITGAVLRYGTDQNYSAGSTTRVYVLPTSTRENKIIDGLLVSHDQDGTLIAGAVDNAAVLASNVVTTAKILDANVTNAKLAHNTAWASWTPTYTNLSLGSGTVVAKYQQIGKAVHFRFKLTLAADSSVTGEIAVSLPVTAVTGIVDNDLMNAKAYIADTGTATYPADVLFASTTTMKLRAYNAASTYGAYAAVNGTVPHSPGNTDYYYIAGSYECA